jgi:hypothetical protein
MHNQPIEAKRRAKRRGLQAMAKARGLKPGGGEKCPGCPGEACSVVRLGDGVAGGGSDGQQGRMVEGEWHCNKQGRAC